MTEVHICREIQHLRDFAFFEKKAFLSVRNCFSVKVRCRVKE